MTDTSTEFDWSVRNPEVIVRSQPAIAVYTNTADQVVLAREREGNEEEDAFVLISREHAIKVAHAILEAAGQGDIEFVRPCGGGYEDVPIHDLIARGFWCFAHWRLAFTSTPRRLASARSCSVTPASRSTLQAHAARMCCGRGISCPQEGSLSLPTFEGR
jgi:hypothetical protein